MLGVLGGMGPAATVDFLDKLVRATPATRDQDHVPVVVWADPRVPDRTDALLNGGSDPTPALVAGTRALLAMGAEQLVVLCNTAHVFLPRVAAETGASFLDMIDATASELDRRLSADSPVGLLAGTAAVTSGLYARPLALRGRPLVVPTPDHQADVMAVIRSVKAGDITDATVARLRRVVQRLKRAGAVTVIAGCTEIPLVLARDPSPALPAVDPTDVLARLAARSFRPAASAPR
jgi:aspartate racemase